MFPRLSLDLIYALPGQTAESWSDSLRRAAGTGAEHLSPYQLTIEAGTPFDRAVRRGRFRPADEDAGADLYDITQSTLEALGLHAYEVSNHARGPAAQARHNLVYWRGEDYVGAGPGAHGRLTRPDGVRLAAEAEARIGDYIGRVEREGSGSVFTPMTDLDRAEERLLMGLRTDEGAPLEALSPLPLSALPDLVDTGHLSLSEGRLVATAAGRPVLDHLIRRLIVA
jgi:oxygen-independent coproporphyrinogen-3 oxidase